MSGVKFFIEGKADRKFLLDYLKHLKIEGINDSDFIIIGSNNESAIKKVIPEFERSAAAEKLNILIFDSDSSYSNTISELERIKTKLGITFIAFLFPNNNSEGNLETLLENVINQKHLPIFECFEGFQKCLSNKSSQYKVPATKTKIFAYVDALVSENESDLAKEPNRDYLNSDHWDLSSSYLDPLKEFLQTNVQ